MAAAAPVNVNDDTMASVIALSRKAVLLSDNGLFARAAEKYATAVAAAQSLAQPDCLIVASLQADEVSMLFAALQCASEPSLTHVAAACERIYCVLLPAIVPALQRRKAAGTLLRGAYRAAETAFFGNMEQWNRALKTGEPAPLAELVSLTGYQIYVCVANAAVAWPMLPLNSNEVHLCTVPLPTLGADQLAEQRAFVLSALELVQQPRVLDTQCFSGEVCLIDNCRLLMSESAIFDALPRAWAQQLRDALQRMERSGVMQQRRMEQGMASNRQQTADACAAAATSAAARGLRRCALPSCGAREVHVPHYKLCAACQTVVYCSKAHQAEHWAAHKAACKVARKAAAEKEEQGGASGA
jgi:hypothetical protein